MFTEGTALEQAGILVEAACAKATPRCGTLLAQLKAGFETECARRGGYAGDTMALYRNAP
jgi:hypothetical protein